MRTKLARPVFVPQTMEEALANATSINGEKVEKCDLDPEVIQKGIEASKEIVDDFQKAEKKAEKKRTLEQALEPKKKIEKTTTMIETKRVEPVMSETRGSTSGPSLLGTISIGSYSPRLRR